MEAILDFSVELDVGLFDRVVQTFYSGRGAEQINAGKTLQQFQEQPDAWRRVNPIMQQSSISESKILALGILDQLIKSMWKVLPPEERDGIKNYIVQVIIDLSSTDQALITNRRLLAKLNLTLVQILKQEWPHNWPSFIPEIVSSSKQNLALCENNMIILKLLSEEIFDFSAEQMTQAKTKNLKNQMCNEFSEIFQLCFEILQTAQKPSLVAATLETLLRFLNWIPLGYIFQTNLIELLVTRFLKETLTRNTTLKCLTEIGGLQVGPDYNEKFAYLFTTAMPVLAGLIPPQTNIMQAYHDASDDDQQLIQNVGMFLTSFLGAHLRVVEDLVASQPTVTVKEMLFGAHQYILQISRVQDRELFKVCLEYWQKLVSELYEEQSALPQMDMPLLALNPGMVSRTQFPPTVALRKALYAETLSQLRVIMIERMVKPEEVLVVENDEGEIVREMLKESDTIVLYKSMREVLVYLTHLDVEDTERIMSEKLSKQMDESEWSFENLNKLCWAVGSISGAMNEDMEKKFLVSVIKDLLCLCELKRGKDNKACVASNIMYIVGQYPRFLKAHWKFLKTVVNKLFEFMHELHEGVQDMACDTFIKIAQKCRRHFVVQQNGEILPFIEEILSNIEGITIDLAPAQIHVFFEAIGYMISAQPAKPAQERLISMLMRQPNEAWGVIMLEAQGNADVLNDADKIKILGNILKSNVAACTSIGAPFMSQIGHLYHDLLAVYKAVSELISQQVAAEGEIATKKPRVRGFRTVKREILKLMETYISKADDLPLVTKEMIPPLLETVLGDYARNVEPAKDAEVLNTMASIVARLGEYIQDKIPLILEAVFECTLNMINKNFEEYPEHRVGFFRLLQAINQSCFPALLNMPAHQFRLFLDSVVWAFKHTMRDISEMGLNIILELLNNFSKTDASISNAFYQAYFMSILQDVLFVLTNGFQKSGFKFQSMILLHLFEQVDSGKITVPLFDPAQVPNPNATNQEYVRNYVMDLLQNAFPHLQRTQTQQFVVGLFELNKDYMAFKAHLRDFLVTLKEFSGDELSNELFIDEREAEAKRKAEAEREAALRIPGMIKPSDR
ncbi:Karyopherin transporter [Rhizophlyctis rosea]|uniref:Karyopherin transporter n=1 Tax=Rhizophlyctis rosea TaxID=64517 RepID=A0AAD5S4A6_9FUNG|nr:Karyopherin transporter [Rhizophlyctis rosea]